MRRLACLVVAAACSSNAPAHPEDYAAARRGFHTVLLRQAPAPQAFVPLVLRPDATAVSYPSTVGALPAWRSVPAGRGGRAPAVVFLHGGHAFSEDDWDMTAAFRRAGFVVMTPMLRGENGAPGAFSLVYDEVDDARAAARWLASQPDVDPARVFAAGHSLGGTVVLLAAMAGSELRAVASLSGPLDAEAYVDPARAPFDPQRRDELRLRSPAAFAAGFRSPARLYVGRDERAFAEAAQDLATRATAAGRDVAAIVVPGDHGTMTGPAIALAVSFFLQPR